MYCYLLIVVLIVAVYWLYTKAYGLKVYWFHRPDCGHCTKMEPEWSDLEKKLNTTSINYRRIDINDPKNKKISENFDVAGVPHIVKIDYNGCRHVYSGPRKCNDFLAWLYE
jgi:thiol-disulfide isomerase/thioredoxin